MKNPVDNSIGYMLKQLNRKTQFSTSQLKTILQTLSADVLINLKAAVDTGHFEKAKLILTSVALEPVAVSVDTVKQKLLSLEKDESLGQRTKITKMLSLISELSPSDWQLVWPTLDQKTLKSLWHHASNKSVETVGKKEALAVLKHAKEKIMEKLVYQDKIVEVQIPRGPNNTVGILLDQKLTMVPRSECTNLNEHVLGMTGMPSLARMLMLAGVDTLPEAQDTAGEAHLPMGMRVVVEFDPDAPMDQTRVKILNVDSTITLEGLRSRIRRQFKELSADLASDSPDYIFAASNSKRLANSLETMQAALQDLQVIRQQGGARTRNIPQVMEDEDN